MTSPYDPEAVAKAMAGGVVGTLAALREENARLRAEVERLRDIISPGDAAAYEESMAALQADVERLTLHTYAVRGRAEAAEAKLAEADMQYRTMSAEAECAIREWKAKLDDALAKLSNVSRLLLDREAKLAEAEAAFVSRETERDRLLREARAEVEAQRAESIRRMKVIGELQAEVERLRDWQLLREREIDTAMTRAEAEVERLRVHSERQSGTIRDLIKRAEAAEADRDEWRDTARSEMAGRAALQAEVARLALIIQRLAPEVKP